MQMIASFRCTSHKSFHEYFQSHPQFMRGLCTLGYFGGEADNDLYSAFRGMYLKFAKEFFFATGDDFRRLTVNDRRALAVANAPLLARFKSSLNIQESRSCITQRMAADTRSGLYPALRDLAQDLDRLNLTTRSPKISYSQFYVSPWAASFDDEIRHLELMIKIKNWPRDAEDKPIDGIQITLMKLVMAFSSDFVQLEQPKLVQETQMK